MSEAAGPRRARVLIVDDEVHILAALRRSLRREGWEIVTRESPEEALDFIEANSVDLILSDHMMPGMTGVEMLDASRRLQPDAIRMLITGWSEAVTAEDIKIVGLRAVIPKPWDDAQLKKELRAALEEDR